MPLPLRTTRLIPIYVLTGVALAGCQHIPITESTFIRPDALTGKVFTENPKLAQLSPLEVARPDGAILRGVLLNKSEAAVTVLYFGDNGFHIDQLDQRPIPGVNGCLVSVVAFDYRGYGRSMGQPDLASLQADALAVFDAVDARHPGHTVLHGQSLGSIMAAHVGSLRKPRGIVLESTGTTVQAWADTLTPWYLKTFISFDIAAPLQRLDNARSAASITSPTLVLVGESDGITPPRVARQVFDAIPTAAKQLLIVPGMGHNAALASPAAQQRYCKFVERPEQR